MTASPLGLGCSTTYRAYSSSEVYEIINTSRISFAEGFAPRESLIPVKVIVSTFPGEGDIHPSTGTIFLNSLPLDPFLGPHEFVIGSYDAMKRTIDQAITTFSHVPVSNLCVVCCAYLAITLNFLQEVVADWERFRNRLPASDAMSYAAQCPLHKPLWRELFEGLGVGSARPPNVIICCILDLQRQ